MPTVRLSFSPAPAHVGTARLVAVAVARRAGVAEELLEEIRLAIGEACSRAVTLHRTQGLSDMVEVAMDDDERFTVRVLDHAGNGGVLEPSTADAVLFLTDPPTAGTGPSSAGAQPPGNGALPAIGALSGAATAYEAGGPYAMSEEAVAAKMGLALLAGLVDDLEVAAVGNGTQVSMSWPLPRSG
jgi:anti-sigma regulatory factor (Ser/Thr protein kinase)